MTRGCFDFRASRCLMSIRPRPLSRADDVRCVSLACPLLDALLRGGLRCGSITELTGEQKARARLHLKALELQLKDRRMCFSVTYP
jgi:hypothetical protein